ncbi:MAG: hypothetical protein KF866_04805 [Phycisphaeraceae bacterium]|nr:hypothetical protein [Phycisphaeraceae bacterium]MCW5755537.1 hypothetical protein [Phycisphaeraceae bacterium]
MPARPSKPTLREAQDCFIASWGKMGSAWGISRTMAEVHALLYVTGQALCTDDVMERLQISRGNASMSLRALLDWGVVTRTHKRGDRKEYYVAEQEIWTMARAILRERLKREIEPLTASLYEIRDMIPDASGTAAEGHNARLDRLLLLVETLQHLMQKFVGPEGEGLQAAASLLRNNGDK